MLMMMMDSYVPILKTQVTSSNIKHLTFEFFNISMCNEHCLVCPNIDTRENHLILQHYTFVIVSLL